MKCNFMTTTLFDYAHVHTQLSLLFSSVLRSPPDLRGTSGLLKLVGVPTVSLNDILLTWTSLSMSWQSWHMALTKLNIAMDVSRARIFSSLYLKMANANLKRTLLPSYRNVSQMRNIVSRRQWPINCKKNEHNYYFNLLNISNEINITNQCTYTYRCIKIILQIFTLV